MGLINLRLIATLLCAAMAFSCQNWFDSSGGEPDTFRIAAQFPPDDLHPYHGNMNRMNTVQIYSQLFAAIYKKDFTTMRDSDNVPDIADKLEILKDGKECIVTIKKKIKFHNGEKLTAKDVEYSILRWNDSAIAKERMGIISSSLIVEILGNHKIQFKAPISVDWKEALRIPILSKKHEEKFKGKDIKEYIPMGSGPYEFTKFDRKKGVMVLDRFEEYYGGKPKTEKLEIYYFNDEEEAIMALLRVKVDYLTIQTAENASYIMDHPGLEKVGLFSPLGSRPFNLFLNTRLPKLGDSRLRKAISLLIDRKTIVKDRHILNGIGIASDVPLHLSVPFTKPIAQPYNAEEGLKLLKELGYERDRYLLKKEGEPLSFTIMVAEHNRPYLSILRNIQKNLLEAGIMVSFKFIGWEESFSLFKGGKYEIAFTEYVDWGNLYDNHKTYQSGSEQNFTGFSDPAIDAMFLKLSRGEEATMAMKKEMQKIIFDKAPVITLFYQKITFAMSNRFSLNKRILSNPASLYWFGRTKDIKEAQVN